MRTELRRYAPWALLVAGVALTHRFLFSGELQASRDLFRLFIPQSTFLRERLLAGELPLWNPYLRLGQPFMATLDAQALYPPRVLFALLFGPAWGVNLQIALHAAIASAGAYLAARAMRARPLFACVAALYGLTPMFVRSGPLLALSSSAAWSGFILLGALQGSTRMLGLALGASCLCGAPEMVLWQCVMALLVARRRAIAGVVLGLCLGAVVLLPAAELALAWRGAESPADRLAWSASVPQLLSMAWLFADQPRGEYWGPDQWLMTSLFVGAIPFVLACLGWRRSTRPLFILAGVCLFLSLGANFAPSGWALAVPPLSFFRYPAKYLVAVAFVVAVLAPMGLRRLSVLQRPRVSIVAGATLGVFALGLALTQLGRPGMSTGFFCFGVAVSVGVAAFLLKRPKAIAALAIVECVIAQVLVPPSALEHAATFDERSQIAAEIRSQSPGRVSIADDETSAVRHSRDNLLPLRWMEEHLRAVEGYGFRDPANLSAALGTPGTYALLGVTHFVRRPGPQVSRAEAFPRAFIVQKAAPATDAEALAAVREQTDRLHDTALLADGPAIDHPACESKVQVTEPQPEQVRITADACDDGVLVLADGHFPGWSVTVDGEPSPLWRADLLLRATPVKKGAHEIVFSYRPYSLWAGGAIALLALLYLLIRPPSFGASPSFHR